MSSLHVNRASVNILLAPHSPACLLLPGRWSPPLRNSLASSWPETMQANCHDSFDLDPNCRDKMAWGTNPLLQNEQSSDPYPFLLFLDLRAHEQCTSHAEQQRCSCPQRSHSCAQRWQKLFLLQVRLLPGCRNTYFLPPPFPRGNRSFTSAYCGSRTSPFQRDFSHKRQRRGQLISTCECPL